MTNEKPSPKGGRWFRLTMFALASVLLGFAALRLYATIIAPWWDGLGANDLIHYLAAVDRWIETSSPYPRSEVLAPFEYGPDTFLHPPITLLLIAPFKVLPWALWWIIPLGIFAYVTLSYRPAPWTWPLIALILCIYPMGAVLWTGNSDMWAWAFFAAGLRWSWPFVLLAVKPSLAIVGLLGVKDQRWWMAAAAMLALCAPFEGLWVQWIMVLLNSPGSLLYSAGNVVIFAIPVLAKLSRGDLPSLPIALSAVTASAPLPNRYRERGRWRRRSRPIPHRTGTASRT